MSDATPTRDVALSRLRQMVLIRRFEEKCAEVYTQQKIRGFLHLYIGEEAVAVGSLNALSADDNVVATYREHGHALVRGIPADAVMAEMFGRVNGCARGRGGSMHLFCIERRFFGGFAIVGGGLPIAAGLALADKMQGQSRVTACFFGDGATDEGEYHETLNLAVLWKLPVLFLCENNQYAMGTSLGRHTSDGTLLHEPAGHGMPAELVDGMDVGAVETATRRAVESIQRGDGPRFIEFQTYRFRAHSMYDAEKYRDKAEVAAWKTRDPIDAFVKRLRDAAQLDDADLAAIEQSVADEVAQSVVAADSGALEPVDDLTRFVYASPE